MAAASACQDDCISLYASDLDELDYEPMPPSDIEEEESDAESRPTHKSSPSSEIAETPSPLLRRPRRTRCRRRIFPIPGPDSDLDESDADDPSFHPLSAADDSTQDCNATPSTSSEPPSDTDTIFGLPIQYQQELCNNTLGKRILQPVPDSDPDDDPDDPIFRPLTMPDDGTHVSDAPPSDTDTIPIQGQDEALRNTNSVKRTRKKQRNPDNWAKNKRKKSRESGQEYIDANKKQHPKRKSNSSCKNTCSFKCLTHFDTNERKKLFEQFWKLNDDKKLHFYARFVKQVVPARKRTKAECSRKKHSFMYHFEINAVTVQVCKEFFLTTLNISQQRIYYFFKTNLDVSTCVAKSPTKGKYTKNATAPAVMDGVRLHIKSFPTVESHYCRASTQKQYLDQRLTVAKMYELYLESEFVKDSDPVKLSMYRTVFNNEFNLSFFKPKKDKCDLCEAFKCVLEPTDEQINSQNAHISNKIVGKHERDRDRASFNKTNVDKETAVLCFDMQNVFALPKAAVSNFFYKRKLNSYNLTAHCSLNGVTYCAIWHEALSGRAGNHIASAIVKILHAVVTECPDLKHIILWSDSCVPQNRNSLMSTALLQFLLSGNVNVETIEQKFSEPGHGLIQEVDAIHSKIERGLNTTEVFSHVSLLRNLKALSTVRAPLRIIQIKPNDFYNYQVAIVGFNFNHIPYSKVKHLKYQTNQPMHVQYKLSFHEEFHTVRLSRTQLSRQKKKSPGSHTSPNAGNLLPRVSVLNAEVKVSAEKTKDLMSMFKYMPTIDQVFYTTVLKVKSK